jgi:hypothetical protein
MPEPANNQPDDLQRRLPRPNSTSTPANSHTSILARIFKSDAIAEAARRFGATRARR